MYVSARFCNNCRNHNISERRMMLFNLSNRRYLYRFSFQHVSPYGMYLSSIVLAGAQTQWGELTRGTHLHWRWSGFIPCTIRTFSYAAFVHQCLFVFYPKHKCANPPLHCILFNIPLLRILTFSRLNFCLISFGSCRSALTSHSFHCTKCTKRRVFCWNKPLASSIQKFHWSK